VGGEQSTERAIEWLKRCAENENDEDSASGADATWNLYRIYSGFDSSGNQHEPLDAAKGRVWLQRAADAGNTYAEHGLAICKLRGSDGFEKDEADGRTLLQRAADAGHTAAQIALALCKLDGTHGFEKDDVAGREFLQRVAAVERARVQHVVAISTFCDNEGVVRDAAAGNGEDVAQYALGSHGFKQNNADAWALLQRAAEAGHVDAVYDIVKELVCSRSMRCLRRRRMSASELVESWMDVLDSRLHNTLRS
jgi:TPR repeat protein